MNLDYVPPGLKRVLVVVSRVDGLGHESMGLLKFFKVEIGS